MRAMGDGYNIASTPSSRQVIDLTGAPVFLELADFIAVLACFAGVSRTSETEINGTAVRAVISYSNGVSNLRW